jgi:transcriptional regulator GlxA family with amidase domain
MDTITKPVIALDPANETKIATLCEWIAKNCDHPITWDQLTEQSNLSHSALIHLFKVRLKVTPMGYVRRCINLKTAVEATQVEHKPYGQWISKVSKTPPNR